METDEKCLRCQSELTPDKQNSTADVFFYICENCNSSYAKKPNEALHDRWMSPLSIPLYGLIFEKNHVDAVERIATFIKKDEDDAFIKILIEHIDDELTNPKQKVSEIHDFIYPDEEKIREFLFKLKEELTK